MSETAVVKVNPEKGIVRSAGNVVEALQEYQRIQHELDSAMPDCIQDIRGKKFRKKQYWRAIRTAFNLNVECIHEELVRGDKDWGYSVRYRATAPNGSFADGDGTCMASEKNRGQMAATVHNVRAHAHTRAFNRAVSNLVGFGEVSAEEAHGTEDAPEPGSSDGPAPAAKPAAKASPGGSNGVWEGVVKEVSRKEGETNGKKWTRYTIVGEDGSRFNTFDKAHVEFIEHEAQGLPVCVTYSQSKYGKDAEFVGPGA
jgi:hypothetical protein